MPADSFGFTFWGRREGEREHAVGVEDRDAMKHRKMYGTVTHSEEEEPRHGSGATLPLLGPENVALTLLGKTTSFL